MSYWQHVLTDIALGVVYMVAVGAVIWGMMG